MGGFTKEDDDNTEDIPPILLGVRVTRSNTLDKKFAPYCPMVVSGWLLKKPGDYSSFQVSANRSTKIFNQKSSKEQTRCTRADRDTVMVFVLAIANTDTDLVRI